MDLAFNPEPFFRTVVRCPNGADRQSVSAALAQLDPDREAMLISFPHHAGGLTDFVIVVAHLVEDGSSFFSWHEVENGAEYESELGKGQSREIDISRLVHGGSISENTTMQLKGAWIHFPFVRDTRNVLDDELMRASSLDDTADYSEVVFLPLPSLECNPTISHGSHKFGEYGTLASIAFGRSVCGQDKIHVQENRARDALILAVLDGHEALGRECATTISNDFRRHFELGLSAEESLHAVFSAHRPETISNELLALRSKQIDENQRGGTTWVSVEIVGSTVRLLSAGDSYAVILRRNLGSLPQVVARTFRENDYYLRMKEDGTSAGATNILCNSLLPSDYSIEDRVCKYPTVNLESGDIIAVVSDGVEVFNELDLLGLLGLQCTVSERLAMIAESIKTHSKRVRSMDDVSVILFEYR